MPSLRSSRDRCSLVSESLTRLAVLRSDDIIPRPVPGPVRDVRHLLDDEEMGSTHPSTAEAADATKRKAADVLIFEMIG